MKIVRTEGVMALYKGFIPTISRQGPSLWCYLSHLNRSGSYSWICDHGKVETFLLDYVFKQFEEEKHKFGEFKEN